jgi:hypothetical protein
MQDDGNPRDRDLFGEEDIPESKILDTELFMDKHKKEMVDSFKFWILLLVGKDYVL